MSPPDDNHILTGITDRLKTAKLPLLKHAAWENLAITFGLSSEFGEAVKRWGSFSEVNPKRLVIHRDCGKAIGLRRGGLRYCLRRSKSSDLSTVARIAAPTKGY